jgi:hypothetical protein
MQNPIHNIGLASCHGSDWDGFFAVANGDLLKKITVEAPGAILEHKDAINTMADHPV